MKKLFSVLIALVLVLSFGLVTVPVMAAPDVVFSNYAAASGDYDVWVDNSIPPEMIEEFTTENNSLGQWEITGIRLSAYGRGIMGGAGTALITISIYDNAAGTSVVEYWDTAFESIEYPGGFSLDVSDAGVTLDADTTYWFGLRTRDGSIGWERTTLVGVDPTSHVFELTGNYIEAPNATVTAETEVLADVIAISITPTELPFGPVYRGQSSEAIGMEIINTGTVSVDVSTSTDSLFYQAALTIDGISVGTWSDTIAFPGSIFPKAQVNVPSDWPAGMESGTIIFWVEDAMAGPGS